MQSEYVWQNHACATHPANYQRQSSLHKLHWKHVQWPKFVFVIVVIHFSRDYFDVFSKGFITLLCPLASLYHCALKPNTANQQIISFYYILKSDFTNLCRAYSCQPYPFSWLTLIMATYEQKSPTMCVARKPLLQLI